MDVSSKYFAKFSQSGVFNLTYVWRFLLDIQRVGKLSELISFVLWETMHRLRLYQAGNQYVRFTDDSYLSIRNEENLTGNLIFGSFIAEQGLCFQAVDVDWKYCVQTRGGVLLGCCYSQGNALVYSDNQSESAVLLYTFGHPITSLFINQQDVLFVCSNGVVYKSDDLGNSFKSVLSLSTSISYFLFNNGMTELPDQTLMIGEYGSIWRGKNWQNLAFLYYSFDGGDTWNTSDFLMRQGVTKHIHLVKYCSRLKSVLLTDGDNKKQLWMNTTLSHYNKQADRQKTGWRLINKFHHQTGGYMSMAETDEAVLFGSDYLGGTNFIVSTTNGKQFRKLVLPDPYRRSPVMNMITRQSSSGNEIWAVSYSCLSGKAKSLLMCTKDSGQSWAKVIEFDGTKNEVRLASSSSMLSDTLYISITDYGHEPSQHKYRVYKVDSTSQVHLLDAGECPTAEPFVVKTQSQLASLSTT